MKYKSELENHLAGATSEYVYENHDADFNVLAVISCEDGWSDVHIIENDEIDGYILCNYFAYFKKMLYICNF